MAHMRIKADEARRSRKGIFLGGFTCMLLCAACSTTQLAVSTQAEVMELAFPSIEEQTDYDFARSAIPGNLVQIEGLLRVQPDNERLLLLAARGFTSYAYGFVEDELHQAEQAGDLDAADRQRARARAMYLKAKDYGWKLLRLLDDDVPAEAPRDPDELRALVRDAFDSPEHASALFWTGNAWGLAINLSRDEPALLADLPFARVLVERAVELDERYYNASGHVFLGVAHASLGQSMGGQPETGRAHFEKALALTERRATLVHVNYAESYAVQTQNRDLFTSLLEEVLAAPIPEGSALTLPNTIARRRAQRLLAQVDSLVLQSLDDLPAAPPDPPTPEEDSDLPDAPPDPPEASEPTSAPQAGAPGPATVAE